MSEEIPDRKSHLGGESEGRCLYSGDSHDDNVARKRRKVEYHDEQVAAGVQLVDEGEREEEEEEEFREEEMRELRAGSYSGGEVEEVGQKEKELEEVGGREGEGGQKEVEVEEKAEEKEGEGEEEEEEEEEEEDDDDYDYDDDDDDDEEEEEEEEVDHEIYWRKKCDYINSCLNKEIKEMSIDQFSALPDSLLIHILSFLNTREAVVTSVLSKRWRFLWTDLPKLELNAYNLETAKVRKFVAWFRRALVVCSGNHLQKFEVCFHYEKRFASDVNVWVEFVKKNKVKSVALCLNIDYLGYRCMRPLYKLPRLMYSNSYVTHLTLQGCIINPRRSIKWGSLTKLYLDEIELDKYIMEKILSSCPVLYDLTLAECWGVDFLEFNSQSLHVLALQHWNPDTDFEKDVPLVKISAPYIHSLTVFPKVYGRKVALTNISALVKAKIDFNEALCAEYFTDAMSHTNELLEGLQHVKDLEVGHGFLEVLSMLAATGWRLPQSDRECLTIHTFSDEYCIPGIICLLESSPNLRTFTIISDHVNYKSHEECSPNDLATSYFKEADLNCDLLHLKTVNMRRFANLLLVGEPMLTVAQLLLKRATVLDKMVIEFESYNDYWIKCHPLSKYVEITETLLSYERSSPNAVVLVTSY